MAHNRIIHLSKGDLKIKIQENKLAHIKDYEEAVIAYRNKANELIKKAKTDLDEGSLKIVISLITPINKADEYDKIMEMLNWEINDTITLTEAEFTEYVLDETPTSNMAKFSNSSYR